MLLALSDCFYNKCIIEQAISTCKHTLLCSLSYFDDTSPDRLNESLSTYVQFAELTCRAIIFASPHVKAAHFLKAVILV